MQISRIELNQNGTGKQNELFNIVGLFKLKRVSTMEVEELHDKKGRIFTQEKLPAGKSFARKNNYSAATTNSPICNT